MAEEVKLKITGDSKEAVAAVDAVGGSMDIAGKKVDSFAERIGKMNPKELAERVMSIEQSFGEVGNAIEAVATNDIPKFEQAMASTMRGVVGVVGLVAPQFAPIVAVLTPVITKTLEWALGMQEAAEAAKRLAEATKEVTDELKDQNAEIDYQTRLQKLQAHDRQTNLELDLEALRKKGDAEAEAYLKRLTLNNLTEEEIRAHTKFVEDQSREEQFIRAEIQAAITAQEVEEIHKRAKETDDATKEAHKAAQEEEKENAGIIQGIREALNDAIEADLDKTEAYLAAARFKGAKSAADASDTIGAAARKASADQAKAALDAKAKVTQTYEQMFNIIKLAATDWKGAMMQVLDLATKKWVESMAAQAQATATTGQTITSATGSQVKAFEGATASVVTSSISKIAPGVAGWAAALGPFGLALVPGLIAAFMALARKAISFEEGGSVSGRVPGLGRNDDVDARLNSREGVVNETGMAALGGAGLDALNRGQVAAFSDNNGHGGSDRIQIVLSMPGAERPIVRAIMQAMNVEVLQHNGTIVANQVHLQSGRAI